MEAENWKVSAYDGFTERNPRYRLDLLWIWCTAFAVGCQQGLDDQRVFCVCMQRAAGYFIIKINMWFKKARKKVSFSHVKAKQDQECGGKVCRNTKGSASCFSHVKAKQGISILFFSRQSKASVAKTSCDSKMADKTVVQERENQCKAEIFEVKETSSAQCPVGLKGRRPHAPRGPTVPLQSPTPTTKNALWLFPPGASTEQIAQC